MENFDAMAKGFDTEKRMERSKRIADEIRLHIVDGKNKSALEYGCGTGLVGFQLIDDFGSMLFADSSQGMIEQVRQKLARMDRPLDSAICWDIMADTPRDFKVDYVFLSLVLHHIQDAKTAISRLYNVLNDSGHLLIVDLDADNGAFHAKHQGFHGHDGFVQSELIQTAKQCGFAKAESKSFYSGHKAVNGQEIAHSFFILDAEK